MLQTVALLATLALTAPAESPRDAAGWKAEADLRYAAGDYQGSLAAASEANALDRRDPWSRYAWIRALAIINPDAARSALPGLQDPAAMQSLPAEERAEIENALGYLALDLGLDPQAAFHFAQVPAGTARYTHAQAGLAILAVRRGHSRQALTFFIAARVSGKLDAPLAELERETRFQVVMQEFSTARDLRDANAAGRAYATLDELRPHHPATLRARADLALLRGDAPARERALRELLAVDQRAPGAASELVDTLLEQHRPQEALRVARKFAPDRLAGDVTMQAIERNWVPHLEAALGGRWRDGQTSHDRLELPQLSLAWTDSSSRFGRYRFAVDAYSPDSDDIAVGEPYGSSPALAARFNPPSDDGAALLAQWAPSPGVMIELGHTPTAFAVSNLTGALRFKVGTAEGPWSFGIERLAVEDSLLSFAGADDPLTGGEWGGVTRNRAYLGGHFGGDDLTLYGTLSGALLDGRGVEDNSQWEAEAGFWKRAVSGDSWRAHLGGNVRVFGYDDNRSHFTVGHGGYFSPHKFLAVGPTFDLRGSLESATFRLEGGVAWQVVRESSSEFFPANATLQASSGDPRYAGDSREGVGAMLAASVEWRVSGRAVAGLRLEGSSGKDYDEVRLQVYARHWSGGITEPLREPPLALMAPQPYELN